MMKEDDLIKEAELALKELEKKQPLHGRHKIKKDDKERHNPFAYLLVLILLLLIIMMAVPYYGVKLDPEPENVPSKQDITPPGLSVFLNRTPSIAGGSRADYARLILPDNQAIRNTAVKVATAGCRDSQVCYSKALFYFVRDEFVYIGDPPDEYLDSPFETLKSGAADCDGLAILLANLQAAIGVPTRFAFIPGHVYVQVKIDDAPNKYKEEDGWISLDPTCSDCGFGEVPYTTMNKRKEFLYT